MIEASQSMTRAEVAAVAERLGTARRAPERNKCDNGAEFISRALDKWAYKNGVTMDFLRPGKTYGHHPDRIAHRDVPG